MDYTLSEHALRDALMALMKDYRVFAPVRQQGAGRLSETDVIAYREIEQPDEIAWDEKSYFSPKELVFPVRETLFKFQDNQAVIPTIDERPVLAILRPCDINGLDRQDTIYLNNGPEPDFYYKRRRDQVHIAMLECTEGFDTCYCVSMNANKADQYDLAIRKDAHGATIKVVNAAFTKPFEAVGEETRYTPAFIQENKVKVIIPAVDQVKKHHFDHEIWKEYTRRCIACGRCNTSCPTCTCFTMQDVTFDAEGKLGERRRRWAGCHVDGFSDMAGGHSFRNKNGERMRFKTMHKINDFHRRFDKHMCVGCGRCDDVCPEYISFSKCINKLNQIIEEETK